ncbi:S8 family serine peptidase [Elizabethkingia ursingii]
MARKSHLKIKNERQIESSSPFRYNYGFGELEGEERAPTFNNIFLANQIRQSVRLYQHDLNFKYENRDAEIEIPLSIDYIRINFIDQFNIKEYNQKYYNDLGLESVEFTNFGTTGLFAVIDDEKFDSYLENLRNFVNKNGRFGIVNNRPRFVGYIKSFSLLTYKDIISYNLEQENDILFINLIDLPADEQKKKTLLESLFAFLYKQEISFIYDEERDRIEIQNATKGQVLKIVQNFDVIISITSSFNRTIGPSEYNTVQINQAFNIINADDDLPIIAILDTGISKETPLKDILIQDNTFTLGGDPFEDKCGWGGNGHGTAVAALAALGRINHINEFNEDVLADAKLLSVKILKNGSGSVSESKFIEILYAIKEKYPTIKIFVLTTCYEECKKTNERFSEYTLALDKFSHETDSLIFICTANNYQHIGITSDYDFSSFGNENSNLCTPADSMNNIVVGAASDNFFNTCQTAVSPTKEFPAIYSRTGYLDQKMILSTKKVNKNLFKPDIIDAGGDLGYNRLNQIDAIDEPALKLLSALPSVGSYYGVGTSFSTPLVANVAAKIQREYPEIKSQTIKALLINNASLEYIKFPDDHKHLLNISAGNGIVNDDNSVFSDENAVTFILEDEIKEDEMKIYPINIPSYIVEETMGKKNGVLRITATLCFSFLPIKNNQLSYCPIHIAYSFFKKHSADQILMKNDDLKSFFKSSLGWSQNGRYISKPIPYSNSQKINFVVNCNDLVDEDYTIKLGIHCKVSKQIVGGLPVDYPSDFPFSIVFKIEETIKENTGQLYDELVAINEVEILNEIEVEDIDLE